MDYLMAFLQFLCIGATLAAVWMVILIFLSANHKGDDRD